MAKYVVPPKKVALIKCWRCKTLYAPDPKIHPGGWAKYYEACPVCGTSMNTDENRISLWRYNLIKYFRGGFRGKS